MALAAKSDIVVFGATGFTGRLVTEYLAHHPQRAAFSLAVAARSASKLRATIDELGLSDHDIRVITVDTTDPVSVEQAVKQARVVINTVGPFFKWGLHVVRSCVRHSVHYVDLSGEAVWIKKIITLFDFWATKTHAVIVPACGYDSIPSDISAYLANKTLKAYVASRYPAATSNVGLSTSMSAHRLKTGLSGGTVASFVAAIEEVPAEQLREGQNTFFLSPMKGTPPPMGKLVYHLDLPGAKPLVGAVWVMKTANAAVVQRTAGLYELQARTARAELHPSPELERLTYGNEFVYDEFLATKSSVQAVITSFTVILGAILLNFFKPVRYLAKTLLPSGSGPSLEQKETGYLYLTNISTSVPTSTVPELKVRTDVKVKGDPGYYKTAVMIAEAALCLVVPPASTSSQPNYKPLEHLPSMAREGGVLTPMTAFGEVLIQRLRETGSFDFSSSVVEEDGKESRKDI